MKLSDQKNKTTYQTKRKFSFPTCFQMLQLPHFCRKLIELIPRIRIPETDMEKVSSMQALLADNFWKIVEFFNKQLNFDSFSHQCPQVCIIILNQYIFVKIYSIYLKNWYTGHFYMPNFFHVWPESLVLFLSLGKMFLFSIQHIHTTSDGTNRLLAKSSPNFWRSSLLYQHFRRWPQKWTQREKWISFKNESDSRPILWGKLPFTRFSHTALVFALCCDRQTDKPLFLIRRLPNTRPTVNNNWRGRSLALVQELLLSHWCSD